MFVLINDFCRFRSSAYTTLNKMVTVFMNIIFAGLLIISLLDVESQNVVTMARKAVIVPNVPCDM